MIFIPLANTLLTLKVYLEVWFSEGRVAGTGFGRHKHKEEDFQTDAVLPLQRRKRIKGKVAEASYLREWDFPTRITTWERLKEICLRLHHCWGKHQGAICSPMKKSCSLHNILRLPLPKTLSGPVGAVGGCFQPLVIPCLSWDAAASRKKESLE